VTRPPRKASAKAAIVAEKPSLRDTSFAQIVQSIEREESNDGTHEKKPALIRRRRMGPEPGEGVP